MPKYETVSIPDATEAELRAFASQFLGIELDQDASEDTVRAAIGAAHEQDFIYVAPPPPPAPEIHGAPPPRPSRETTSFGAIDVQPLVLNTGMRTQGGTGRSDPKITINFNRTEDEDGNDDVMIGVNGVVFQCMRGEDVEVPYRVYEVLKLANKTVIDQTTDRQGQGVERRRDVKAYPYTIVREPPADEVAAWRERVDSQVFPM